MKTAVAIRHIHFEDLGTFEGPLKRAGYQIYYLDAGLHDLEKLDPLAADLLFVLGGPIGACENATYPFLDTEYAILRARMAAKKPVAGICLGAQIIANILGAKVYPAASKEIGFAPLELTEAGLLGPLRHLKGVKVLHWHGDTFDLPNGCAHLAASKVCTHQAFSLGRNVLGLQFHAEAPAARIERWLIGHACELAGAHIDPCQIREDAARFGPALEAAGNGLMADWLARLATAPAEMKPELHI